MFVQSGYTLSLSMNRPSIYLSLFHRESFLFCFGAADTLVDRVATESAIACQVKAFAQAHWLARTPKSWPLSCFGPGSAGVCFVCQKSGYDWKKGLGTGGESVLDLDRRIRLRAFWACGFLDHVSVNGCFGLRVSIRSALYNLNKCVRIKILDMTGSSTSDRYACMYACDIHII